MHTRRNLSLAALATVPLAAAAVFAAGAAGAPGPWGQHGHLDSRVFASGGTLTHSTADGPVALTNPDDITALGTHIFVAFQNGVGPQGEANPAGNADSTVVEFTRAGAEVAQWDVVGKCDGLTADPLTGKVIATVNEDLNSSLYLITPRRGTAPAHYAYSEALPHNGGTDAISVDRGMILISASSPGTVGASAPQATYPAVYRVRLNAATDVATIQPLFFDEATATVANTSSAAYGTKVALGLTDPDSNEIVPSSAPRFAGDFMLTSQGDQQQIFVRGAGRPWQSLAVLNLSASVDDTAWATQSRGAILTTDNSNGDIYEITGRFRPGTVFVAVTPCNANDAPSVCPAPGFPGNYLGTLNPYTGQITAVNLDGPAPAAQGMIFLPR